MIGTKACSDRRGKLNAAGFVVLKIQSIPHNRISSSALRFKR
ncbi:hypothetical protein [Chroococcidiopsis sp. SAG 2025]|nr:hypothetical protein [Chroococcidiopsis sp. SAG 2025]